MLRKIPDVLDFKANRGLNDKLGDFGVDEAGLQKWRDIQNAERLARFESANSGPGALSLDEFLYYRLWDDLVPDDEVPRFLGVQQSLKHHLVRDLRWDGVTFDKVTWDLILGAAGIPRPELVAVHATAKAAKHVKRLDSPFAVAAYLRDPANYPMIAKPNFGGRSIGVLFLESVDFLTVHLNGGQTRSVNEVAAFICGFHKGGYLFQKVLKSDPRMNPVTGGALASCRVSMLITRGRAALENITIKLPRKGALIDNFWRGNMLGAVDKESGQIVRAISGTGFDLTEIETNPDTGARFADYVLPEFGQFKAFMLDIATVLPGLGMQGWDVALTDKGPIPIELNPGGDVNLPQLAHNKGVLTPSYMEFLHWRGWDLSEQKL